MNRSPDPSIDHPITRSPDYPILSDSHCHLQLRGSDAAAADPDLLLERARAAGVRHFLVPGTTLEDSREAIAIAERHPDVVAAVGIHPHEAKGFDPLRDGGELEELARHPRVAAIGEVGLDFHYDHSPRETQIAVFEWMLDLARRANLPAILHNRESGREMRSLLDRQPPRERPGVYHSFTESAEYGRGVVDLGYKVSFSGMITFRPAENIRDAARGLPLDAMLVETDTPFLAPVPHRGRPGEPAFVIETAKKLAEVKGVSLDEVALTTTANFEALFGARAAGR